MFAKTLSKSIFLLFMLLIVTCLFYPFVLWLIGQIFFSFQANGSLIYDKDQKALGSKLIAQPFTQADYFQPRPSAAAYDASASASSALAASNPALRDRVARMLGPLVKYQDGKPVGPDIEKWFQQDQFQGQKGLVAQWASLHKTLAKAWVDADPSHAAYVTAWSKSHPVIVNQFMKENPNCPNPKAGDLAVVFFQSFSKENPGKFPSAAKAKRQTLSVMEPAATGSDIQAVFFDLWLQDHPGVLLQALPADLVTTSASGLDPHISLENAQYQLERVAAEWAKNLKRNPDEIRKEISQVLKNHTTSAFAGLAGGPIVNVLETNLELRNHFGNT